MGGKGGEREEELGWCLDSWLGGEERKGRQVQKGKFKKDVEGIDGVSGKKRRRKGGKIDVLFRNKVRAGREDGKGG